jgi:hypothetical protein
MSILFFEAFANLMRFEFYLSHRDFATLYRKVREYTLGPCTASHDASLRICCAVDLACIWYWKQVLCLQRSAATVCLLRKYGIKAELVLGAKQMPFRAHAWVEIEGRVVSDKPYVRDVYGVLDRC